MPADTDIILKFMNIAERIKTKASWIESYQHGFREHKQTLGSFFAIWFFFFKRKSNYETLIKYCIIWIILWGLWGLRLKQRCSDCVPADPPGSSCSPAVNAAAHGSTACRCAWRVRVSGHSAPPDATWAHHHCLWMGPEAAWRSVDGESKETGMNTTSGVSTLLASMVPWRTVTMLISFYIAQKVL